MFKVLHSSAGAGKTHALVKQYLTLALRDDDPSAYARILALTFTNKAASEMRARVLAYLEALAEDRTRTASLADVQGELLREAGITAEELRHRAQAMLTHMLHHWPQVAIGTIDTFTRRVVMPFARELQLDQELRMTTEEEYYRAKAVDLLLEEAGDDAALTEVLVATCEQLLEEERSWRPDRPLLELSRQLTREDAMEHLARLAKVGSAGFLEVRERLRHGTGAFRQRMRALGRKVLEAVREAGLSEDDFPYRKSGYISYFRKLAAFDEWQDRSSRLADADAKDEWHAKKADGRIAAAINGLVPLFRATYREVEGLRDTEMRRHAIAVAVLRDLLPMASLNALDQRLEALKRSEGVSFFSDLTRKVMSIVQREPAPFLYERLGERYRHFLIDEFQDTSLMQWHALLPLVENALSGGGSVLLVGDAKQAIYRWRNGEARQFTAFPDVFRKELLVHGEAFGAALRRGHVPVEPLASNYRSARSIIRFNNGLAAALKERLTEGGRNVYGRHEQEMVSLREGYVEVDCYGRKDKDDGTAAPWALMVKAVRGCLADGFRPGNIAVLVRSGRQGAMASAHLAHQGWPVVAPDGLSLGHSPAVAAVVRLLAWLQHPMDANAALAAQAIAVAGAEAETVDPFPDGTGPGELMAAWAGARPDIHARLPLTALVNRIATALGHDPATDIFAMGLVQEAHAFANTAGDDLPGFLEHWERTARKRSVGGPAGADAIQVMTIHKAKGLEFPVVIVPEAGKKPNGAGSERIWISPEPPVEGLPVALVGMRKMLSTELAVPEMQEEEELARLDELNVLYVALTRPVERLYISVQDGGEETWAAALCGHLGLNAGDTWTDGKREAPLSQPAGAAPAALGLRPAAVQGERQWWIRQDAPEEWDPADPDPFRHHGKAIHAVLARVRTVNDLPGAMAREGNSWGLPPETADRIARHLAALLDRPDLAPFYGAGLQVHTETALLDPQGHLARPDRVVDDGEELRVLDIKTGRPSGKHREQVRGYVRLLQEVEQRPVKGFLLYVQPGEVVAV